MDWDSSTAQLSLAVHESAHAVVGFHCDLSIDFLKLEYGWWSGDLVRGFVRFRGDCSEEEAMSWAATTAAGSVAQEKFLLDQGFSSAEASALAMHSGSLDNDELVDMVAEFGVSELAARSRAEVIIDAHWPQIVELSVLLYQRGRLSGSVVR